MTNGKKEVKFNQAAALHYAEINDIAEVSEDGSVEKIVEAIENWMKSRLPNREMSRYRCDCDRYILDPDKFCWYCGGDVTEDNSGGFDPDEKVSDEKIDEKKSKSKKTDEKKEKEEKEEGEDDGALLNERTERILALSRDSGTNAWNIGLELYQITSEKLYRQGKYKSFDDYCKNSFGMERVSAYNYIRISQSFDVDEIKGLTYEKLLDLAKVKDKKERKGLTKAAKPKSEGGKGLTRSEVKEEVAKNRKNTGITSRSPGRPSKPRYSGFVGDTFKGKWDGDDMIVQDEDVLGAGVGIEVKKLKKGLKFEIIELEDSKD